MFDDLRERSVSPFEEEDVSPDIEDDFGDAARRPRGRERPLLGLTAMQRFVLALMLFLNVFVLGCFCLLATGRVMPIQ